MDDLRAEDEASRVLKNKLCHDLSLSRDSMIRSVRSYRPRDFELDYEDGSGDELFRSKRHSVEVSNFTWVILYDWIRTLSNSCFIGILLWKVCQEQWSKLSPNALYWRSSDRSSPHWLAVQYRWQLCWTNSKNMPQLSRKDESLFFYRHLTRRRFCLKRACPDRRKRSPG